MKDIGQARLERAYRARCLYEAGDYVVWDSGLLVTSAEAPGGAWFVDPATGRCDCPDATVGFAARAGIPCKHAEVGNIIARASQPGPRRLPRREEWDR